MPSIDHLNGQGVTKTADVILAKVETLALYTEFVAETVLGSVHLVLFSALFLLDMFLHTI